MLYRVLFGIVALTAAVFAFFFVWGLGDGTVSATNILLWLSCLAVPGVALFAGHALARSGQRGVGMLILALIAVPAVLVGIFLLMLVVLNPGWH